MSAGKIALSIRSISTLSRQLSQRTLFSPSSAPRSSSAYIPHTQESELWYSMINYLRLNPPVCDHWIRAEFHELDSGHMGRLAFDRLACSLMPDRPNYDTFRDHSRIFDSAQSGFLNFCQFDTFWRSVFGLPIFASACRNGDSLSIELIIQLFSQHTQASADEAFVRSLFQEKVSYGEFCRFVTDPDRNSPLSQEVLDMEDPMDRPLSHYFIASSHNTYIETHQLAGKSSKEGYENAFIRGARCVELDLYNRSRQGPVITHGGTMVTNVPASEVNEAVGRCAFAHVGTPVILSLEDYCDDTHRQFLFGHFQESFMIANPLARDEPIPSQIVL
jgi:hypothetical protein